MDTAIPVRALHVLGVVLWIGGVAFVTTVLLPAVRRMKSPEERVAFFEAVEGRFGRLACFVTQHDLAVALAMVLNPGLALGQDFVVGGLVIIGLRAPNVAGNQCREAAVPLRKSRRVMLMAEISVPDG